MDANLLLIKETSYYGNFSTTNFLKLLIAKIINQITQNHFYNHNRI